MNQVVSMRLIAEAPAAFLGSKSPWRRAPVLMTRGTSFGDLCGASTVAEASGQGRHDALDATMTFVRSTGFLDPRTTVVSLAIPERRRADPISLGRDALNDLVIDCPTVSRGHARIFPPCLPGGRWRIVDAGSSNGTMVGGMPLKSGELREIDEPLDAISLGSLCFLFVDQDLFSIIVCEAVGQPWATGLPDTKKVVELPAWQRLISGSEDEETESGGPRRG